MIQDYMQEEANNNDSQPTENRGDVVASQNPTEGVVGENAMPNNHIQVPLPLGVAEANAKRHREARQTGLPTGRTLTNEEMYAYLNKGDIETPEKTKAREKRERRNKTIAAIGDGLGAISNMITTSAGADSLHNPQNDISPSLQKMYDEQEEKREKRRQAYMSGLDKARQRDLAEADSESQRNLRESQANYYERKQKEMDDAQDNKLKELDNAKAKIDAAIKAEEEKARQAAADAEEKKRHNEEVERLQKERNQVARQANDIRAYAAKTGRIRANKYQGGGSGKSGKGTTPTKTVKTTYVGTGKNRRAISVEESVRTPYTPSSGGGKKKTGVKWK